MHGTNSYSVTYQVLLDSTALTDGFYLGVNKITLQATGKHLMNLYKSQRDLHRTQRHPIIQKNSDFCFLMGNRSSSLSAPINCISS